MSRRKVFVRLVVIFAILGIIYYAAQHYIFAKPPAMGGMPPGGMSVKVEAVQAKKEPLSQKLSIVGNLSSNESVTISTEISGRVAQIPFKEGGKVKKGDLLFKLDDSVQKAELSRAEANLKLSKNNVRRYAGLVKSGAISKLQFEQAQSDLNLALANSGIARANLQKTSIRAPFSGVAGIRQVSLGQVVQNGDKLVNLEQMAPIRVLFAVPEKNLTQVKAGDEISIYNESYPDTDFAGKIFAIDPRVSETNRSVSIQALSPNVDGKLFPGQFVSITIPLESDRQAVVIPDQALVPEGTAISVYKVIDGKAKKVEVKTGLRINNKAEIISGVEEGDTIITAGQLKIHDGAAVRVAEPTPVKVRPITVEDEKKVLGE